MRPTLRALAAVRPAVKYIQPGLPTGLTGLRAAHSPRSRLMFLYNTTLEKLKEVPESALYRQSVENLTRHRLGIVEAVKPEGVDAWNAKMDKLLQENADKFEQGGYMLLDGARAGIARRGGQTFIVRENQPPVDEDQVEWDGEPDSGEALEGSRTAEERDDPIFEMDPKELTPIVIKGWEPEPQLTVDQVAEIEDKIGSGLIEELVQVAEGELKLIDVMIQSKPWENLEEQPAPDQWKYFERKE